MNTFHYSKVSEQQVRLCRHQRRSELWTGGRQHESRRKLSKNSWVKACLVGLGRRYGTRWRWWQERWCWTSLLRIQQPTSSYEQRQTSLKDGAVYWSRRTAAQSFSNFLFRKYIVSRLLWFHFPLSHVQKVISVLLGICFRVAFFLVSKNSPSIVVEGKKWTCSIIRTRSTLHCLQSK